jgi:hypothetical protein
VPVPASTIKTVPARDARGTSFSTVRTTATHVPARDSAATDRKGPQWSQDPCWQLTELWPGRRGEATSAHVHAVTGCVNDAAFRIERKFHEMNAGQRGIQGSHDLARVVDFQDCWTAGRRKQDVANDSEITVGRDVCAMLPALVFQVEPVSQCR